MLAPAALRHLGISLGLAAALLALWLRLLMPLGWMPASSADGVTYVMCGTAMLAAPSGETPSDADEGNDAPCAFAGVTPGLETAPPLLMPLALTVPVAMALPMLRQPGQMLAWLRPPLRGPPAR